ncbi:MAG: hypothetical protein AB7S38_00305 [Vulcanimicrobiota bacterium]
MRKAWLLVLLWCCGALAEPLAGPSDLVFSQGRLVVAEFAAGRLHGLEGCPKGLRPWSVAEGEGAYWLADPLNDRVGRLDATGWTEFELEVKAPTALAYRGGRLFLAEKFGRVLELDPRSGGIRKVVAFGLDGVGDLAAGEGELFVSLPNQGSVERIKLDGSGQSELAAGLNTPLGLVAEPGHVYVGEALTGTVWELPLDRPGQRMVGETHTGLCALAREGPNTLVACNLLDGSLSELDLESGQTTVRLAGGQSGGSLRFELENRLFAAGLTAVELDEGQTPVHAPLLGAFFARPEQLVGVVDSTLGEDGTVYYSLTRNGQIVSGWGERARVVAEGLKDPAGLTSAGGTLYVAELGRSRVVAVLPNGGLVPVLTGLSEPVDVTRLPGKGLVVIDRDTGRVVLLSQRAPLVMASGLSRPTAVEALPDGDLAVVEAGADRVVRLSADGAVVPLLTVAPGALVAKEPVFWTVIGGLAVDPVLQRLYVAVPGEHAIRVIPLDQ